MKNRMELLIAFLMTLLLLSSILLDPAMTISLLMILVLIYVVGRQIEKDDHLPQR